MGYGHEVILGWQLEKDVKPLTELYRLGLLSRGETPPAKVSITTETQFWDDIVPIVQSYAQPFVYAAQQAYLADRFGPATAGRAYQSYDTPMGPREFAPMSLCFSADEDVPFSQTTYGVCIVGRYFPDLLDWQYSHGGSGEPQTIDKQFLDDVAEFRDDLSVTLPVFRTANPVFVTRWF